MRMKGIIFDFNGVLWWDTELQEHAWSDMAATLRGLPLSDDEIAVHVHGRTNRHTLKYLMGRTVQGDELTQLTQHKERIYRQLCLDQGAAFTLSPGATDLLDFLAAHQIPRTIATASEKTNLDFFIAHLHLDRSFDIATIVYDDGTRPGKPAPDIYLQAAHQLRLAPAACIVVEDSQSGIQAAHAAGIGTIIALGPSTAHQRLAQLAGVSAVIENLQQFPKDLLFQ